MRRPEHGVPYAAFVDMSGGSSDDAVLAIFPFDDGNRAPESPDARVNHYPRADDGRRIALRMLINGSPKRLPPKSRDCFRLERGMTSTRSAEKAVIRTFWASCLRRFASAQSFKQN